jgi:hypothetical protein
VDGKGTYDFDAGSIWTGKIVDGKPDGSWVARRFHRYSQPGVLATEEFINGTFRRGSNATGVYDDSSRISLLNAVKLPFINAERFLWAGPCDTNPGYKVQFAHYPKGRKVFISEIRERLTPVLNLLDRATFITPLKLHFTVLPEGSIEPAPKNISDAKLLSGLKDALRDLPNFAPATVNGKPVHQRLVITIEQVRKGYIFSYALWPFAVVIWAVPGHFNWSTIQVKQQRVV